MVGAVSVREGMVLVTYVGCVQCGGTRVQNGRACVETPYYRSSSHTLCVNMPLGANNSS
jgi:hypothetical protein